MVQNITYVWTTIITFNIEQDKLESYKASYEVQCLCIKQKLENVWEQRFYGLQNILIIINVYIKSHKCKKKVPLHFLNIIY